MKKILSISLICLSFVSFSQNKQEELVVVEKPKRVKAVTKSISISKPPATLKQALITGFKTGNATAISAYFSQNVDISVLHKENLYSKSQAEQVLKTFFLEHKPTGFTINHEGQSSATKYFIGTLKTANGTFRVTVNTKSNLISKLSIEK